MGAPLKQTTHHEAGHVVYLESIGVRVIQVKLIKQTEYSGEVKQDTQRDLTDEAAARVAMAGPLAEAKFQLGINWTRENVVTLCNDFWRFRLLSSLGPKALYSTPFRIFMGEWASDRSKIVESFEVARFTELFLCTAAWVELNWRTIEKIAAGLEHNAGKVMGSMGWIEVEHSFS